LPKKYKVTKTFTFDGKRYYVHADSEAEAIRKMTRKQMELEQGLVTYDGNMLFSAWADTVISIYKVNVSDRTKYEMVIRLQKHVFPNIGSLPIGKIKPLQCQAILNQMEGMSKSYINKVFQDMRFIFEKAKENKMILENPASRITRPKGTALHRRSITDHERRHLLNVFKKDRCYILFLLMLYCGCRPAEAADVCFNDVQEKNGIPFLHIRGTKTINSDRWVPIPPDLYSMIGSGDPFSPIAKNAHGRHHSESSYKRMVARLKRDMNISMGCRTYRNQLIPPYPLADDFVPYCLRHTYCTDLQKAGVDIRTAQKLMGHADISTTANIYTHQDDETLIAAAEKMGCVVPPEGGCNTGCNT